MSLSSPRRNMRSNAVAIGFCPNRAIFSSDDSEGIPSDGRGLNDVENDGPYDPSDDRNGLNDESDDLNDGCDDLNDDRNVRNDAWRRAQPGQICGLDVNQYADPKRASNVMNDVLSCDCHDHVQYVGLSGCGRSNSKERSLTDRTWQN